MIVFRCSCRLYGGICTVALASLTITEFIVTQITFARVMCLEVVPVETLVIGHLPQGDDHSFVINYFVIRDCFILLIIVKS